MSGDVTLTIQDGGAGVVQVPASSLQVVIGPANDGPENQIVATRSPKTLTDVFSGGPLCEAAALSILKGATILAVREPTVTPSSASAVTFTGTGTSLITVTGTPNDAYYVVFKVIKGGTKGTAGITFQLSLDAGRHFGPILALGTAASYTIPGTGVTLDFAAGTLVAGDVAQFATTEPLIDTSGVQAAMVLLKGSQFANSGWGSTHIVSHFIGSDATTIEGDLDDLEANFLYTRAMIATRDASPAAAWGGTGESESTWSAALATSYSAVSAKRICASAGHYNMPSAYPTAVCGAPSYRRSLAWALAQRQAAIPPQRHAGRVRDGSLSAIAVDPAGDAADGFLYHDEFTAPSLDAARFASARTRRGRPGFFIQQPNLMAPPGSQFSLLPFGNVMDVACTIVHQIGEDEIDEDVRLNDDGTIFENEAKALESTMRGALVAQMVNRNQLSNATVVVDRLWNVLANNSVKITVTIFRRGYVLSEEITIGFSDPFAAGGG
jgi:hypothetical protein